MTNILILGVVFHEQIIQNGDSINWIWKEVIPILMTHAVKRTVEFSISQFFNTVTYRLQKIRRSKWQDLEGISVSYNFHRAKGVSAHRNEQSEGHR